MPVTAITLFKSVTTLLTLAKYATQDPALSTAMLAEVHEGELEFVKTVLARLSAHEHRLEEVGRIAQQLLDDKPTLTALNNLGFEAAREELPERREMLMAAVGGILRPEFDTQRRARLVRKLSDLDPEEVRHLYGISRVPRPTMTDFPSQPGATDDHHAMARLDYAGEHSQHLEVLASTGCVVRHTLANYTGEGLSLTSIGTNILLVVEDYVVARGSLSQLPPPRGTIRREDAEVAE